jgi:hypothetical protein
VRDRDGIKIPYPSRVFGKTKPNCCALSMSLAGPAPDYGCGNIDTLVPAESPHGRRPTVGKADFKAAAPRRGFVRNDAHAIDHASDASLDDAAYISWPTEPQGWKVCSECPRKHPSCFWA